MTNTPQNWEEEFDIQFPCVQVRADDTDNDKLVKDFIRTQRKQACREMIKYMRKRPENPNYGTSLTDVETEIRYFEAIHKAEEYLNKMP